MRAGSAGPASTRWRQRLFSLSPSLPPSLPPPLPTPLSPHRRLPTFGCASQNVISPCGRVASSVFNDTLTLLKPGGTEEVSQSSKGIAWATDVEFKFHNAADGSTGTNFAQFAFERNQPCAEFGEGVPTTLSGPVKLDADGRYNGMLPADWIDECVAKNADAERAPGGAGANIGWCFPGSGMCVEDEHFIVWMRTAGQANFRKLYATIDEDLEPGTYTVRVSNGVDAGGGYKKYSYDKAPTASCDSLTAPAEQAPEEPCVIEEAMEGLYNTSVFGGTKKVFALGAAAHQPIKYSLRVNEL